MLFIEYPQCSICQKAKKWLDEEMKLKDRLPEMGGDEHKKIRMWFS